MGLAYIDAISLLSGTNPYRPLLGFNHYDVLVEDVADEAGSAKLEVNSLVRPMHMAIAEGNVANRRAANRANSQT